MSICISRGRPYRSGRRGHIFPGHLEPIMHEQGRSQAWFGELHSKHTAEASAVVRDHELTGRGAGMALAEPVDTFLLDRLVVTSSSTDQASPARRAERDTINGVMASSGPSCFVLAPPVNQYSKPAEALQQLCRISDDNVSVAVRYSVTYQVLRTTYGVRKFQHNQCFFCRL
jgi:hypothetical protein